MIEIKDINKTFGENHVLQGITAQFKPGLNNLIIGGSGSGKTTLLKCIVGLHEPTSGEVFYDGVNFTAMHFRERVHIRKQIGMLFQNSALFDSMTVEQNIIFPLNLFTDMPLDEKHDRANYCLKKVDLENKNKLFPSELSGGMKKRVGIARAISMNPKYLFVDEPNSGLDPLTSILIDNLINEITEEFNTTTVIVTHDMNSVMGIGDHVLFLNQGQKWWEGTKTEIAHTKNKELNEFVFASKFMRAARAKL